MGQTVTLLRMPGLVFGVAELLKVALLAFWLARDAYLSSVMDQLMRERDPVLFRNLMH